MLLQRLNALQLSYSDSSVSVGLGYAPDTDKVFHVFGGSLKDYISIHIPECVRHGYFM